MNTYLLSSGNISGTVYTYKETNSSYNFPYVFQSPNGGSLGYRYVESLPSTSGGLAQMSNYPEGDPVTICHLFYEVKATAIATTSEASVIGGQGTGNNKCVAKSELDTYGCKVADDKASLYANNQCIKYEDVEESMSMPKSGRFVLNVQYIADGGSYTIGGQKEIVFMDQEQHGGHFTTSVTSSVISLPSDWSDYSSIGSFTFTNITHDYTGGLSIGGTSIDGIPSGSAIHIALSEAKVLFYYLNSSSVETSKQMADESIVRGDFNYSWNLYDFMYDIYSNGGSLIGSGTAADPYVIKIRILCS